ncbi:hypothetical protein HanXRQr2_Chr09g0393561 [Helianthus annuus]|uniref:Uncharacterized protein n=1 Tax=Helianthus annuus TaxID=4232 RepID=A0A9K3I6D5_HELAN|nr:hypothetical protein HanXRQr2_Chr09g0393561 [Helianthus annuus]
MRFMFAPTRTPRYLKGGTAGLHPTSEATLTTSSQRTPIPKRWDLSILILKPELIWKHRRTRSMILISSVDHSPIIIE